MNIHTPENWELPESAATAERDYLLRPRDSEGATPRRDFLKRVGLSLAGAAMLPPALRAATAGFPPKVNADFRDPALKPTAYELITSYNNFYEFGTGKGDPKPNAEGWKTEP